MTDLELIAKVEAEGEKHGDFCATTFKWTGRDRFAYLKGVQAGARIAAKELRLAGIFRPQTIKGDSGEFTRYIA